MQPRAPISSANHLPGQWLVLLTCPLLHMAMAQVLRLLGRQHQQSNIASSWASSNWKHGHHHVNVPTCFERQTWKDWLMHLMWQMLLRLC